jgi:SAM-dependent methyltransferase
MLDDAVRWDARYRDGVVGNPRPPDGIERITLPSGGVCLDVACGLGEQTLWAAMQGFEVIALDVSATAVAMLTAAASEAGLADRVDARVFDLDAGLPDDVRGRCALVICQRFRSVSLYPQLVVAARPGGVIVVTVLSRVGLQGEPGAFHAPRGELLDGFRALGLEIVHSSEADGEATLVARRGHSL